jgi:hypothetical protein
MNGARTIWTGILARKDRDDFSHIVLNVRAAIGG